MLIPGMIKVVWTQPCILISTVTVGRENCCNIKLKLRESILNAQKQKYKMTPLHWGDMIFPSPLISFHQKPGGGKGKWMDHLSSCDVIWSDRSQWDAAFQHGWCTHAWQTHSAAAPEPFTPLLLHRKTAGDALTATAEKSQGCLPKTVNPMVLPHDFAYLHLPWWLLPTLL